MGVPFLRDSLSLVQFVGKAAWTPSRMLGLFDKGHLAPGAAADLPETHRALLTVAGGRIIMSDGMVTGRGGTLVTTDSGVGSLKQQGVDYEVADLGRSLFYSALSG